MLAYRQVNTRANFHLFTCDYLNLSVINIVLNETAKKTIPITLIYIVLTLQLIILVDTYAVNVLWWDQWDFLYPLFQDRGYLDIFKWQHGPHRQGLAFVLTSFIYKSTNWNVRIEAFFMVGLLFVTSLLFSITNFRLNKNISLFDSAIPLMILSSLFYETIYQTPNASHGIFPLFLLSVIALGQTFTFGKRILVTTVSGFFAIFSGFGLFAGLMVTIWTVWGMVCAHLSNIRHRLIVYTTAFLLMTVGFYLFFYGYAFNPAVECYHFPHSPIREYFIFLFAMLGFFDGIHCSAGVLFCYLSLVIGFLQAAVFLSLSITELKRFFIKKKKASALTRICIILGGFSAIYMISTAIGRVCISPIGGQAPRYLPLVTPAYIALYFYLRQKSSKKLMRFLLYFLFVGLFLKALVFSFPIAEKSMSAMVEISKGKTLWIESYLETGDLIKASELSGFKLYPDDPMVLSNRMRYLHDRNLTFFQNKKLSEK